MAENHKPITSSTSSTGTASPPEPVDTSRPNTAEYRRRSLLDGLLDMDSWGRAMSYSGWTRPKSFGLPGLGAIGSLVAFAAFLIAILAVMVAGIKGLAVWSLVAAPPVALFRYRNRAGRDGWQIIGGHIGWQRRKHQRTHVFYRSRIGKVAHGEARLPGLLANSELLEAEDVYGQPFALIHLKSVRHYTVLIQVEPDGNALVDSETHDLWVTRFGQWLAKLAHEDALVGASVTVETAPDPGHRLSAEIDRLNPDGRINLSKNVLEDIRSSYPRGAAAVHAHIALTYNAKQRSGTERELSLRRGTGRRPRDEAAMAAVIAERLPAQIADLAACGVSAPAAMTAQQVCDYVRTAYDPEIASTVDACHADNEPTGITWAQAGPTATVCGWDWYRHDSGASTTFEMVDAPRGAVESRVLEPLLAAHDSIDRKRVTILYRPHDPATAASVADRDRRTAYGRLTARNGESRAHDERTLAVARATATAEASGAGLVRFSLLATATVNDMARLTDATAAVARMGRAAHVHLRSCRGVQDSAFTAALGVGVVLTAHTAIPSELREWL